MSKFKAIVVGAGGISRAWVPPLKAEGVEVAAVVDLDLERAEAAIETHELAGATASDDLAGTLAETDADFAVDLTIPAAHAEVTCRALEAGLHVIGEKPMAASMDEARRMVAAAGKADRLYMVSQSRRYNPLHEALARAATGGAVGPVTTLNCDFFLGAHFGGFRAEMESPLILDMAIHHFDLARKVGGVDPLAVYCDEFNPEGSWYDGDAAANAIFEMTGGVRFAYRGSWCSEGCTTSWNGHWRVVGENGTLLYERDEPPRGEVITTDEGFIRSGGPAQVPLVEMEAEGQHGAIRELLAYLREGTPVQGECHDNIKSLAMVFAAMESSREKQRVEVRAL